MNAVFKREFKSYFINMSGYLFVTVLLLFAGIFVTAINLKGQYAAFEYAIENIIVVFLLIVPVLTMKSVAEDRHSRTDTLLYSLPVRLSSVVLGKFFAMVGVFLIPIGVMAFYPLILSAFGTVHFLNSYASLLGFLLLGTSLISVCMFMSSLTESQVIAAVTGFAVTLLLYFMSTLSAMIPTSAVVSLICILAVEVLAVLILYYLTRNINITLIIGVVLAALTVALYFINSSLFEGLFPTLLSSLALFERFNDFTYGIFNLKDVLYYLSFSAFFVFLTVRSLEKKRWA